MYILYLFYFIIFLLFYITFQIYSTKIDDVWILNFFNKLANFYRGVWRMSSHRTLPWGGHQSLPTLLPAELCFPEKNWFTVISSLIVRSFNLSGPSFFGPYGMMKFRMFFVLFLLLLQLGFLFLTGPLVHRFQLFPPIMLLVHLILFEILFAYFIGHAKVLSGLKRNGKEIAPHKGTATVFIKLILILTKNWKRTNFENRSEPFFEVD